MNGPSGIDCQELHHHYVHFMPCQGGVFPLEILPAKGVLASFICHGHMLFSEEVVY